MRRGQSHPLPRLWLLSEARNDAALEASLARLPRGSGFVYRHYHLAPRARRARFDVLASLCRRFGHRVVLAASALTAREWGADGFYAAPAEMAGRRTRLFAVATAHNLGELVRAERAGADAVMLSPVFPTRSHPGAKALGPVRFRLIARHARVPIIALGGIDHARARRLGWPHWAAIDGLSCGVS